MLPLHAVVSCSHPSVTHPAARLLRSSRYGGLPGVCTQFTCSHSPTAAALITRAAHGGGGAYCQVLPGRSGRPSVSRRSLRSVSSLRGKAPYVSPHCRCSWRRSRAVSCSAPFLRPAAQHSSPPQVFKGCGRHREPCWWAPHARASTRPPAVSSSPIAGISRWRSAFLQSGPTISSFLPPWLSFSAHSGGGRRFSVRPRLLIGRTTLGLTRLRLDISSCKQRVGSACTRARLQPSSAPPGLTSLFVRAHSSGGRRSFSPAPPALQPRSTGALHTVPRCLFVQTAGGLRSVDTVAWGGLPHAVLCRLGARRSPCRHSGASRACFRGCPGHGHYSLSPCTSQSGHPPG